MRTFPALTALLLTVVVPAAAQPDVSDKSDAPDMSDLSDSLALPAAPPALPPIRVLDPDTYVPSCLITDEYAARRLAFTTPRYTPVVASWRNGGVVAAASATSYPGMMAVESATLGIVQQAGNFTFTAYGGASKYGYFRGLSTQWRFGGSARWQFSQRVGVTLFGSYATGAYRPGMAPGVAEMLDMPSFGGYFSWDITDRFGIDMGAAAHRTNLSQWEVRPIFAPYYKVGDAKLSVDVGGIVYELLRGAHEGPGNRHNPSFAPPKPVIQIGPRD